MTVRRVGAGYTNSAGTPRSSSPVPLLPRVPDPVLDGATQDPLYLLAPAARGVPRLRRTKILLPCGAVERAGSREGGCHQETGLD